VDRLLGEHGIETDSAVGRAEFERRMEARRTQETDEQALESLRRGWCLGSEAFRQQLLRQMEGQLGDHHSGEMKRESSEAKAERIIADQLERLGWSADQLRQRAKSANARLHHWLKAHETVEQRQFML
jgi:hypothetical protein